VLDARLRRLIDPPLDRLGAPLAARGVSANAVTVTGFALGLGAAAAIASRAWLLGLALLLLNRLCDGLDGAIARRRGLTDLGGFLDIVLDFLIYAAVPFAFALADPAANALRGRKSLYYLGGLTEGTETIAAFVLACLWPALFPWIALVFGLLCWLTTATRIAVAVQTLR
jgi:hypothetical protein